MYNLRAGHCYLVPVYSIHYGSDQISGIAISIKSSENPSPSDSQTYRFYGTMSRKQVLELGCVRTGHVPHPLASIEY